MIMSVFTMAFGIYLLSEKPSFEDFLYSMPIIIFGVYGIFHVFRFNILLNNESIVVTNVFTKRAILFREVNKIESYREYFIVYSKWIRVKVSSDLTNVIEAKKLTKTKIKCRLSEIKITGDDASFFTS